MSEFISDLAAIRARARKSIEDGAVTGAYKGDRKQVVKVLNAALATELVCILRYKRHHYMAKGIQSESVKAEFLAHANEEQQHADWIAERIAIETYSEIIRWIGEDDPSTRKLMIDILKVEEEHADDMANLLSRVG